MAQKRNHAELFEDDEFRKREQLCYKLYDIMYVWDNKLESVRHWLDCNEGVENLFQPTLRLVQSYGYNPPFHSLLNEIKDVTVDVVERFIKHFPEGGKQICVGDLPLHIAIKRKCSEEIITSLVEAYPDGLKVKDDFGQLPLIMAIQYRCSVDIIRSLVKEYPDGAQVKDQRGVLPLHRAVKGFPLETIRMLVKAYPGSVYDKDDDGWLPLHFTDKHTNVEVLKFLLEAYPEGVKVKNHDKGRLPLHCAIQRGSSVEIIQILVAAYPESVSVQDDSGFLPLHIVVEDTFFYDKGDKFDVLKFLLEQYPKGIEEKDNEGNLALHYAVFEDETSLSTYKVLLEAYPESALMKNNEGNSPLHTAIQCGRSLDVVKVLVEAYPEGVTVKNNDMRLPLHDAVYLDPESEFTRDDVDVEVFEFMLEVHPDGAKNKDKYGNLPLHSAIECDSSLSLILVRNLILVYPESLLIQNNNGDSPLHVAAAAYEGGVEMFKVLIESYSKGVTMQNNNGYLPLHVAVINDKCTEVIKLLLDEYRGSSKVTDENGELPLHTACKCGSSQEIIRILLTAYAKGAKVTNEDGRLPLHLACKHENNIEVIKMLLNEYPGGAKVNDNQGWLPLHIVCAWRTELNLHALNLLVEFYPEGIFQKNIDGDDPSNLLTAPNPRALNRHNGDDDALARRTSHSKISCALHKAVVGMVSPHLVKLLIKASPASCMTKDQNGRIPLHQACLSNILGSLDIVLVLLEASEESFMIPDENGTTPSQLLSKVASKKNSNGMLPLHRHARYSERFTVSALRQLFNAYPKGIVERDNRGMLPFHHACLNTASSVDTLMALLQLSPESIAVVDSQVPSTAVTKKRKKYCR